MSGLDQHPHPITDVEDSKQDNAAHTEDFIDVEESKTDPPLKQSMKITARMERRQLGAFVHEAEDTQKKLPGIVIEPGAA